ncbi:MAG TPA: hypothetical protein VF282_02570 [Bacillota bacterium]
MKEGRAPGGARPRRLAGLLGLVPGLEGLPEPERRRLVWIIAAGVVGVALLVLAQFLDTPAGGVRTDTPPPGAVLTAQPPSDPQGSLAALEAALSQRLVEVLSDVEGAGRVTAWVTVDTGFEQVFARESDETRRVTREADAQGGQRDIEEVSSQSQLAAVADAGGSGPPVVMVRAADIRGVLVVAEGAGEPLVRLRLQEAVEAVLGVPAHRIQVISGREDG